MDNLILTENHEYVLDGVKIPGVSEVLKEAGLSDLSMVNPEILERNSAFGKAVHKAIELDCKGTLNTATLDQLLVPYLDAWKAFCEDYGYSAKMVEFQGYSKEYRFGFTIDQLGNFNGKAIHMGKVLLDIKTGHPYPSHKYQIGGYRIAAGKEYQNIVILYLNPEFQPRGYKTVFTRNNSRDQQIFLCALSLYNVKKQEGLL